VSDRVSRILLVEDDEDLAAGIRDNLLAEGYRARVVHDGDSGLHMAMQQRFDLILLDVMLPGMDGFEVCRRLRANGSNVPVLFLTARSGRDDRIRGLREGGDDYLTKPFDLQEMLARVAAILRRQRWYAGEGSEGMLRFGGNQVDLLRYCGTDRHGVEHELTHKEAQILKCLADLEGQVVTRDQILDRVWADGRYPSSRTIDNFIVKLRRRFEVDAARPEHFHTIHGAGYRFTRDPVR